MTRALPPLNWFRAFEASARTLSFTAAAEEIGMTQSAVSQHVKALEQRLGTPLFVRRPRGLALTDAGRTLLPQVGRALESLAQAAGGIARGPDLLTVATSVSVAQWLIAPALPAFTAQHPGVQIRLLSTVWPDDFNSAAADVEVRFGSERQVGQGAHLLEPSGLIALAAPGTSALETLPLIETVGTSAGWAAWGRTYGAPRSPSLFADTYGMALHLAATGNGAALTSALLAGPALRAGQLKQMHPGGLPSQEGYYLSVAPDRPAAAAFADWLKGLISNPASSPAPTR